MPQERRTPERSRPVLARPDRLTRTDRLRILGYRGRGWILCHLGLHNWALLWNPDIGGPVAMYRLCRRCGREHDDRLQY